MNIKYYFAERKYNEFFEKITIKGYSPILDKDFDTLITRLNKVTDLVDDNNESCIVVQSSDWFYSIKTVLDAKIYNRPFDIINFDYTCFNLSPQVYIAFIGSIVTQL